MKEILQSARGQFEPADISMTIGLDLGDRWSRYCVVDGSGAVIEEDRVRTSTAGLEHRFRQMPSVRIVLEAGTHSPWVSRLLESQGHEVIVANARKVRLIYESDRKNDRLDASMLARLGRVDVSLLAPVRHRGAETRLTWPWCAVAMRWWRHGLNL